jgi:hypothetical protein
MRRSCWHDWRLGLGVLLTLLAWGGVAPQAHAGCETPTVVMRPTAGNAHPSEVGFPSAPLSHHSMPDRQPCSGPYCSRAPLAPPAPPTTTITSNQEWACLAVIPNGTDSNGIAHRLEDGPHTPIFHTFRIYHPPR